MSASPHNLKEYRSLYYSDCPIVRISFAANGPNAYRTVLIRLTCMLPTSPFSSFLQTLSSLTPGTLSSAFRLCEQMSIRFTPSPPRTSSNALSYARSAPRLSPARRAPAFDPPCRLRRLFDAALSSVLSSASGLS